MNHTPGPWIIWGRADPSQVVAAEDGPFVAQTLGGNDVGNARLIAAAPCLLAALQGVLRVADRKTDEFDAARAAIAKAVGDV